MNRKQISLPAGEGRSYDCGPMHAIFKADGNETGNKYSVSEWTIAPNSTGPGLHRHENEDELFLVTRGTVHLLIGEKWIEAREGHFQLIPAGTQHDFENRSDAPASLFNVYVGGGFEHQMPMIVDWFAKQSEK